MSRPGKIAGFFRLLPSPGDADGVGQGGVVADPAEIVGQVLEGIGPGGAGRLNLESQQPSP